MRSISSEGIRNEALALKRNREDKDLGGTRPEEQPTRWTKELGAGADGGQATDTLSAP